MAAMACVCGAASPTRAAEPFDYMVRSRLDVERGLVASSVRIRARVSQGEDSVRLWLYADRLAVVPAAMDERSARWIFPGEIDLGTATVEGVTVDGRATVVRVVRRESGTAAGRDTLGADLLVRVEPGPERAVVIELGCRLALPARFGRLGRVHGVVSMVAPWYPLVVGERDEVRFDVPHSVGVQTVGPASILVGDRVVAPGEIVRTRGPYVPVIVAPELFVRERNLGGTTLRLVSFGEPYEPPPAHAVGLDALDDIVRIDAIALEARATSDALVTWAAAGMPSPPPTLTLVTVPSRTELCATAPGIVLVSDRLYEVFPIEATREFHDRALRRAVFRRLLADTLTPLEPVADRDWTEDMRAVLLTDLDDARRRGRARTPEELIGFAAFHPAVDRLLYAPQVSFPDVYFGAVEEPDPFRDDPARARRPRARGRRLLEAARDALSPESFARFSELVLDGRHTVREALGLLVPPSGPPVDTWLAGPTLPVNYRLGRVTSRRARGGGYRHRVEVIRDGARRPEPVEVEVEDTDGHVTTAIWRGNGPRGHIEVTTPGPLADVRIDPRGRLVQSPDLADGHPRGDDATSLQLKPPLLSNFGLNVSLSEGQVEGFVDFAMRRRFDLDHAIAGTLEHRVATTGAALRYVRGLGPKRHADGRVGYLSGGLAFDRIHAGFVAPASGGYRLALTGSAGLDTRIFPEDPRSGVTFAAFGSAGGVRRDDASLGVSGSVGARGSVTVPEGLLNATVLVLDAGWTFGDALPGERQALGGRFLLRGYEAGELVGDARVLGVLEHRYTLWRDLAWNLIHAAWLREVQLAVFGGGGALFGPLEGGDPVYAAEVGAGLRFHFEYGGVQPGVLSVDVAVPVNRDPQRTGSDGVAGRARPPVGLHVAFDQYF